MNAPLSSSAFARFTPVQAPEPEPREIPRLIAIHAAMQRICDDNFEILPDDAHDRIADATTEITRSIITAPITCSADIADKFRFAASLVESDEGGMLAIEPHAVIGALTDLIAMRDAHWHDVQPRRRNPAYESITIA